MSHLSDIEALRSRIPAAELIHMMSMAALTRRVPKYDMDRRQWCVEADEISYAESLKVAEKLLSTAVPNTPAKLQDMPVQAPAIDYAALTHNTVKALSDEELLAILYTETTE